MKGDAVLGNLDVNQLEVEFMNLIVDKADNLRVVDSDSHFSEFAGVHPSKIKQGKAFLHDFIKPVYREQIMKTLCKKNSPYVYFNAEFVDKNGEEVYIYCTGQNWENSTLCRLTLADVSKSQLKQEQLRQRAKEMDHIIDMVSSGVCLLKITQDMHIKPIYMNESACKMVGATKEGYHSQAYHLDDIIHSEDKSKVFQAIGKSMATDEPIDTEFRVRVHKDEYVWCKFNADIQSYDENNNPIFHAVLTNVDRLKDAEEKADLMYEQLSKIFKSVPTPMFSTSLDEPLKLGLVSDDFIRFMGYSRALIFEEHNGDLGAFMLQREIKYVESNIKKQIAENGRSSIEYQLRTHGGKYIIVKDKRKIIDQDDGTKSLLCSLRNVTQKYNNTDMDIR